MFKVGETWVSPYNAYWVTVESETATGFVVSLGPQPRYMGGPAPVQRSTGGTASASQPSVLSTPTSRKPRQTGECAAGRVGISTQRQCGGRIK